MVKVQVTNPPRPQPLQRSLPPITYPPASIAIATVQISLAKQKPNGFSMLSLTIHTGWMAMATNLPVSRCHEDWKAKLKVLASWFSWARADALNHVLCGVSNPIVRTSPFKSSGILAADFSSELMSTAMCFPWRSSCLISCSHLPRLAPIKSG